MIMMFKELFTKCVIHDPCVLSLGPWAGRKVKIYFILQNLCHVLFYYFVGRCKLLQKFIDLVWGFSFYLYLLNLLFYVLFQATGSNGQTSDKFPFTIHVNARPISSTSQQITNQTPSGPTKDITIISQSTNEVTIIVLAAVVVVLLTIIIVYAVYRYRHHKTKSEYNEPVYSDLQRNSIAIEHIYTIAQNQQRNILKPTLHVLKYVLNVNEHIAVFAYLYLNLLT